MRHAIRLECIGQDTDRALSSLARMLGERHKSSQPWVAKLAGLTVSNFTREFMDGRFDYSGGNSVGSRGVYCVYTLEPGVYEVYERTSWNASRRYYLLVDYLGDASEVTRDEARELLATEE